MKATESEVRTEDRLHVLAAILANKDFQGFFHRDIHPERFPLQIVNADVGSITRDLAESDIPAVLVGSGDVPNPLNAQLIIDSFGLDPNSANVTFRFPVEGLSGSTTLALLSDDSWTVEQMRLVEH